ncbi:substrate-binding periplasmic protein [Alteromonas sp. a30]|uniref:substrate-binding periplasmic protein n=1 Tax=Alteromonas sp. a30 TaxID=2730917 RepID=UPI0022805E51|nr:transporter substrate-binding domain-containing protein [Alteromonas sp. a30]MCY7296167.1 transporter substrate-binding domain-containing protein [Alteromonas sp. a30]
MRLAVRFIAFLFFISTSFSAFSEAPLLKNHTRELKISSVDAWLPYIYLDENNKLTGSDYVLLEQVLTDMGYGLQQVSFISDNRRFYALENTMHEVVVGAFKNEKRKEVSYFSKPYRTETVGLFYQKKGLFKGDRINLAHKIKKKGVVGVMNRAAWCGEEFEHLKQTYPNHIVHIESQHSRLKMLELGRVDFVIGDVVSVKKHLKAKNMRKFKLHPETIYQADIHFAFSKHAVDESFMKRFNQALMKRLKEQ